MYVTFIKKKTIKLIAVILVAVLVVITLTSVTGAHAVFYGGNLKKLPVYYVKTEKKKIAISFDCAWGVDYTDKLLEIMKNEEVKCTFFTVEFWTEKYPEYVKKISEHGHEIGTHSATHPHMSKMSEKAIEKELSTSKLAIEKTGIKNLIVAGGVSANGYLREELEKLCSNLNVNLSIPPLKYCTDNGTMIACAAYPLYLKEKFCDFSLNGKSQEYLFE